MALRGSFVSRALVGRLTRQATGALFARVAPGFALSRVLGRIPPIHFECGTLRDADALGRNAGDPPVLVRFLPASAKYTPKRCVTRAPASGPPAGDHPAGDSRALLVPALAEVVAAAGAGDRDSRLHRDRHQAGTHDRVSPRRRGPDRSPTGLRPRSSSAEPPIHVASMLAARRRISLAGPGGLRRGRPQGSARSWAAQLAATCHEDYAEDERRDEHPEEQLRRATGGPRGARTRDLLIANQALSQLS